MNINLNKALEKKVPIKIVNKDKIANKGNKGKNKKKEKVVSLEEYAAEHIKDTKNEFENVVGQDSLTRFDNPKSKNKRKNNKNNNRNRNRNKNRNQKPNAKKN